MLRFALVFVSIALAIAGQKPVPSDTRRQVWAIKLTQFVREPPGWTQAEHRETDAIAFSPGNKLLAVTLSDALKTHLLILDMNSPEANIRQFDLSETCGLDLSWNQRGDTLLVCGTLLRLADGKTCAATAFPQQTRAWTPLAAFWIDSDHVVQNNGAIVDLECKSTGAWDPEPGWRIGSTEVSKGWVLLEQIGDPNGFCQFTIADSESRRTLWPTPKVPWPCGLAVLATGAQAMCANVLDKDRYADKRKLHCWKASGEMAIPKKLRDYQLSQAATSSTRVLAERWGLDHYPWWVLLLTWWVPEDPPEVLKERVVFDVESGARICAWKPATQESLSPYRHVGYYAAAISADGEYVAESGDGNLILYRITQ